jgi:nitroimidazol reductase NimA-like FMN-containing flavoprotein (pyridoxamine 5'-phosphate oxidase superfamily)
MQIVELSRHESLDLLARVRFGRLGCALDSQPYVTPFYYALHDSHIYSFATVGQKIQWMRANPLVCVEVDEIESPQKWSTVVVFGRYEEIPKTAQETCEMVRNLLKQREIWWEPGFARTIVHAAVRPLVPVYFCISIEQITGHHASVDPEREEHPRKITWWEKLLEHS